MAQTSIEWTDFSVNPIRFGRGHHCAKISPGCLNCYASAYQCRVGNPEFGGAGRPLPMVVSEQRDGALWLDEAKLNEVLRRKKPTRYFWCDMTDMFGEWVPDEWIDQCFGIMGATPQHTHQVLTKRADRMQRYMATRGHKAWNARRLETEAYPPRNVWLGVSVEDQQRADERIPHLLRTSAAVRFLSCEPLLGPVNLRRGVYAMPTSGQHSGTSLDGLHWVIVGGESGHGARPMHPDWARSIRDQCQAAGVKFFFKQWGGFVDVGRPTDADEVVQIGARSDRWVNSAGGDIHTDWNTVGMSRVGKKAAGRLLDGREWSEFPERSH